MLHNHVFINLSLRARLSKISYHPIALSITKEGPPGRRESRAHDPSTAEAKVGTAAPTAIPVVSRALPTSPSSLVLAHLHVCAMIIVRDRADASDSGLVSELQLLARRT